MPYAGIYPRGRVVVFPNYEVITGINKKVNLKADAGYFPGVAEPGPG